MERAEFRDQASKLEGKKIVIVGCGAQGLNQGLNMRDSGLDIAYALRADAIAEQRASWKNAAGNGFVAGTFEDLIPGADLVLNLAPDKQHTPVIEQIMPLMRENSCLAYSHGFNIVEEGMRIRPDITVIMVAPKCPGTEVREEYKRGFGVPTLIAVHPENDPRGEGLEIAKACAAAIGAHRAGVLESSFAAEVKSDLMGEQTILCGMLQTGSLLCFDKMIAGGVDEGYAAKLVQHGWEVIAEGLKHGGITNMMNRLSNPAKLLADELAEELKAIMTPLFRKHMDDIMSGAFSAGMMADWRDGDRKLLAWREQTARAAFENSAAGEMDMAEQEYYDKGILMCAMIKAGVELAFETMTSCGIVEESAYYESLHEVPLIANLIGRKKLYEMNKVISDTAEYGCYLFSRECAPLLADFMARVDTDAIGAGLRLADAGVDNQQLIAVDEKIRSHPVEIVGRALRSHMTAMKKAI